MADTMTITCGPGDAPAKIHYYHILLSKTRAKGLKQVLAGAAPLANGGKTTILVTSLLNRATAYGGVDDKDARKSFVKLVLKRITVRDAGEYVCSISYMTKWKPFVTEITKNTTVPRELNVCAYTIMDNGWSSLPASGKSSQWADIQFIHKIIINKTNNDRNNLQRRNDNCRQKGRQPHTYISTHSQSYATDNNNNNII